MVDRLPPYPLGEKTRIPEAFAHSSSIPSPIENLGEGEREPHLSLQIKKEAPPFASSKDKGADYEYLERRLREFGSHKPHTSPIPIPTPTPPTHISSPTPSNVNSNNNNNNQQQSPRAVENDLIALARAVESNSACKLAKCVVCERGLPESFHMQKPVSWLSVCKLAMWALTQDGASYGRKWFSLGRDWTVTPNWKTTIGITMSTYAKRANMFIAGNPNELGLGYYMLPEDATDPYLETTPLIIGRHYRTPNPHSQQPTSRSSTPPVASILSPPSPPHVISGPLSAPSTPTPSSSSSSPPSIHHVRPVTPPRRPASPTHHVSTPNRQRASTPPPRSITPPPQRAHTPPPLSVLIPNPSSSSFSSGRSSPINVPHGPLAGISHSQNNSPHGSPNSDMSSEVAAYMNDPACLMGVIRMRRKRLNGEMQRRAIGERKHTTDTERQLLLDYYDKFGTCTTVPEFTELQHRLGWDAHRTKIWLYNRKTYHHHRPGERRKKPRTNPSSPSHHSEGNYEDSDEEMYYGEEIDGPASDESERDKQDMMDEDHNEYVMELENIISSLKNKLETEVKARKADTEKNQASADKISELEKALAKSEAPNDATSELALLRTQVELYFNDLREEKKKRAQEEIKSLDYLAQINALNVRIATLEKALQSSPSSSSAPSSPVSPRSASSAVHSDDPVSPRAKFDAQGRKVFNDFVDSSSSPTISPSSSAGSSQTPVPISPSESNSVVC